MKAFKMKWLVILVVFFGAFTLKNFSISVDKAYGQDESPEATLLDKIEDHDRRLIRELLEEVMPVVRRSQEESEFTMTLNDITRRIRLAQDDKDFAEVGHLIDVKLQLINARRRHVEANVDLTYGVNSADLGVRGLTILHTSMKSEDVLEEAQLELFGNIVQYLADLEYQDRSCNVLKGDNSRAVALHKAKAEEAAKLAAAEQAERERLARVAAQERAAAAVEAAEESYLAELEEEVEVSIAADIWREVYTNMLGDFFDEDQFLVPRAGEAGRRQSRKTRIAIDKYINGRYDKKGKLKEPGAIHRYFAARIVRANGGRASDSDSRDSNFVRRRVYFDVQRQIGSMGRHLRSLRRRNANSLKELAKMEKANPNASETVEHKKLFKELHRDLLRQKTIEYTKDALEENLKAMQRSEDAQRQALLPQRAGASSDDVLEMMLMQKLAALGVQVPGQGQQPQSNRLMVNVQTNQNRGVDFALQYQNAQGKGFGFEGGHARPRQNFGMIQDPRQFYGNQGMGGSPYQQALFPGGIFGAS